MSNCNIYLESNNCPDDLSPLPVETTCSTNPCSVEDCCGTITDNTNTETDDTSNQPGNCPNGEPVTGCDNNNVLHNGEYLNTAQSVCEAVQKQKEEYDSKLKDQFEGAKGILDSFNPFAQGANVLNNLIDKGFGETEIIQKVANVVNVNIENTTIQDNISTCSNIIEESNKNEIIIGGEETARCREQILGSSLPNRMKTELLGKFEVSDIDQSISGENATRCLLDAAQNAVQEDLSPIETVALNSALTELQGGGKTEAVNQNCNIQSQNKTACQYLRNAQCCYSGIKTERTNRLFVDDCVAKVQDINQDIETENTSTCGNFTEQENEFTLDIQSIAKVINETRSKITSSPLLMFLAVLGILVCIIGVYVYFNKDEVMGKLSSKSKKTGDNV